MAEPLSISILRKKRDDIQDTIAAYENKLQTAKVDLSHVNATLRLFEQAASGEVLPYTDVRRLFKRGEIAPLCVEWITQDGPLDTRQLTTRLMQKKGLDDTDKVLFHSMLTRVSQVLSLHARMGRFDGREKRNRVCVWKLLREAVTFPLPVQ